MNKLLGESDFHMGKAQDISIYKRLRVWDLRSAERFVAGLDADHPSDFKPILPEICIDLFTQKGDIVLDPFCGRGTTPRVAYDMERIGIGVEINPKYYEDAKRLCSMSTLMEYEHKPLILNTTAEKIPLPDSYVKLIVTSPPFWDEITYDETLDHDISNIHSRQFFDIFENCLNEMKRVLRPDGVACIVCDDYKRGDKEFVPCQTYFINSIEKVGLRIFDIKVLLLHVYRHFNYLTICGIGGY